MKKEFGTGVRLRAARHLAGFTSVEALAAAISQRGLGATVLREIESGRRRGDLRDLREVAFHCGLPVEFFTADFSRLPEISDDALKVIVGRLTSADERVEPQPDSKPEDPPSHGEGDPPP